MGVQLSYNIISQKWELSGCGFTWEYDTKEEAEADRQKANEKHWRNIRTRQMVSEMLLSFRYE